MMAKIALGSSKIMSSLALPQFHEVGKGKVLKGSKAGLLKK